MARSRRARAFRLRDHLFLVVAGIVFAVVFTWTFQNARQPGTWQHVYATREGEIGHRTSTRLVIQPESMFVALPHPKALRKDVEVRYRGRVVVVPVLDVGPWNVDDAYWENEARPASERGRGAYRTPVNRAGIDLSDAVFATLGLHDNDFVEWRFVHRGYVVLPRL